MPVYASSQGGTLRQGEILTNLVQARIAFGTLDDESPELEFITHPFAIILSQDCDLEQDYKVRQAVDRAETSQPLPSVLFAEVHLAADLRGRVNSDVWKRVRQNKDERYHFLEGPPADFDALGETLPELGIDFKRYFSIPTDEVYKRIETDTRRRCRLLSPYLEHLSTRFAYYQFRVALPEPHRSV